MQNTRKIKKEVSIISLKEHNSTDELNILKLSNEHFRSFLAKKLSMT